MNHYYTSFGERISQATLDRRIRRAKQIKLDVFQDENSHIHCEWCKRSDASHYDMAHVISVQKCKNNRACEIAYDIDNLQLLCRECHKNYDGL